MPKKRGIWIPLIIVIIVLFVVPVRKYLSSLFHKNKGKITEMQTIGSIDEDSKFEIQDTKKKNETQDEVLGYRLKAKDRIKQIQRGLKNAGFYKGEIDGKEEAQTKRAIRAFQKSKNLKPDSIVGSKTWKELSKYLN